MKYLIIALLFLACKPYNQIAKKPPLTDRDTLNLSKRCMEAFPAIPKVVVVEKVDTVVDESKLTALQKQLNKALTLLDSCKDRQGNSINLDSFRIEVEKSIEKEFKPTTITRTITKEITVVDSAQVTYWRKMAENIMRESAVKDGQIKELKDQIIEVKKKKRQYQWSFYALIGLIAFYIIGRIKRVIP